MKHLIVCPEYPPAEYAGGIGTYVHQIAGMLAAAGETVHVVAALWKGARLTKERVQDRLIIHRVGERHSPWKLRSAADVRAREIRGLRKSSFPPQCFSFEAARLAEKLIEQEGIDLVEGQEFEAPLYYLQLRRALGLGPKRQPPCMVHLHSPMAFIVEYNDWDTHHAYFRTAKRLEDYSIRAADAWLCPSAYLARRSESHYGLPGGSVKVISLPINAAPFMERGRETWRNGTILFVGRLERRKGVMEWIRAAVRAAREDPRLVFEFVGANCLGTDQLKGDAFTSGMVPARLKHQFHFRGEQERSRLSRFFAGARLAVVPSRWENFPNTCVEAMGTGLPVIATREGGMVDMIDNRRTGWLAESADADGLYDVLQTALQTPPADLAEMGKLAGASIRKKCDNRRILEDHLAFRGQMVETGVVRSHALPRKPPAHDVKPQQSGPFPPINSHSAPKGIAVIVTCNPAARDNLDECLISISRQTRQPAAALILGPDMGDSKGKGILDSKEKSGWKVLNLPHGGDIPLKNQGIRHILDSGVNPAGFSFLSAEDVLAPRFIETCTGILEHCPEVGLISGWIDFPEDGNHTRIEPCPGFPYQWASNEIAPFAAVRTEALMGAGGVRPGMAGEFEHWDLFNAVLASNWAGVTVPGILGCCRTRKEVYSGSRLNIHRRMRQDMLARFPERVAADAGEIILLSEAHTGQFLQQQYFMVQSRLTRGIDRILARLRQLLKGTRRGNG